jgi:uncharacterized protein YjbI with pentapeptide repeats
MTACCSSLMEYKPRLLRLDETGNSNFLVLEKAVLEEAALEEAALEKSVLEDAVLQTAV